MYRDKKVILSIDGGGIRGVLPTSALMKLEEVVVESPDTSLYKIFDFLAGTSTGAIIVSGLAQGITAAQILDLYQTRARNIFPLPPWTHPGDFVRERILHPADLANFLF